MNIKRFSLAFVAVYVFIFLFQWLFHGYLLHDMYVSTASLWRPESDMHQYCAWMMGGQLLKVFIFCCLFLRGNTQSGLWDGAKYGFLIALLFSSTTIMMVAVIPYPLELVGYWIAGNLVEFIGAGMLMGAIYKK